MPLRLLRAFLFLSGDALDWPDGYDRLILAETDSTNAHAVRLAPALVRPTWIMAHRQTAARGRRGRPWSMPDGNFAATLIMRPSGDPGQSALRSFAAALALAEALDAVASAGPGLSLKWPNDVLLNGGKVAGILLEGASGQGRVHHLAVGLGVNLIAVPDGGELEAGSLRPVSVLAETGFRVMPETLLSALARAFARWEEDLAARGFAAVRAAWLARAARLGEVITARTTTETITGTFSTIGPDGALVLTTANGGWHSIPAADVFF